ncbi:MAG: glutathione reductase (NADPH), partial [Paracoccaceae bacterium]
MEFDYDLFVIGGGSGGVRAARVAASHGARVASAEEFRYGGTCVIRGCVPKKLLVYAADFADAFHDAAGFGWTVGAVTHDWPRLIGAKDAEITRLEAIYARNLEASGVELHRCRATV